MRDFSKFTREEIQKRNYNLDIFWLKDASFEDIENLPEPEELVAETTAHLQNALKELNKKGILELSKKWQIIEKPEDAIKDPYVLEFLNLQEKHQYSESQLEQALLDHLQEFILELGKGFTFVARQKRITIDNEHYYIDLVFYHRILHCLVLIDLKVGKLDHKDVGQINFYLNYIRAKEMLETENPPVGIILCTESKRSKIFIEYAIGGISNKLFVSKYKLYLPTKKELEQEIRKEELAKIPPLIKQFRQSVLAKAFRGELVPQDPNDEPASLPHTSP